MKINENNVVENNVVENNQYNLFSGTSEMGSKQISLVFTRRSQDVMGKSKTAL